MRPANTCIGRRHRHGAAGADDLRLRVLRGDECGDIANAPKQNCSASSEWPPVNRCRPGSRHRCARRDTPPPPAGAAPSSPAKVSVTDNTRPMSPLSTMSFTKQHRMHAALGSPTMWHTLVRRATARHLLCLDQRASRPSGHCRTRACAPPAPRAQEARGASGPSPRRSPGRCPPAAPASADRRALPECRTWRRRLRTLLPRCAHRCQLELRQRLQGRDMRARGPAAIGRRAMIPTRMRDAVIRSTSPAGASERTPAPSPWRRRGAAVPSTGEPLGAWREAQDVVGDRLRVHRSSPAISRIGTSQAATNRARRCKENRRRTCAGRISASSDPSVPGRSRT